MRQMRFCAGQSVGLLGGSFDPPHSGHRTISLAVLKALNLDFVWWLVNPQNPLKSHAPKNMAARVAACRALTQHPKIYVSDEQTRFGTLYAIDMVRRLKAAHPTINFIWIMGADNLAELHRWKGWTDFLQEIPIVVYPRPNYTIQAMHSPAALRYAHQRKKAFNARCFKFMPAPAWILLDGTLTLSQASSSALRKPT